MHAVTAGMRSHSTVPPSLSVQTDADPLLPQEIEHIRRVFDEDSAGKKCCSIFSPREDAQMFRSTEKHTVPCECIVELYELLWRWGHRNTDNRSFAANLGFAIPDTIVIEKGKFYAWYFVSRKDGALLRKNGEGLSLANVEQKFCKEKSQEDEARSPVCAIWLPKASQFQEARCHSPNAEFLSVSSCRNFLGNLRMTHSGVLQAFVDPCGVSNFLVRAVHFRDRTALCTRTNRALLAGGPRNIFDRAATFEGWEGLSSSSSRYRSHKHPHMEGLLLAAGEMLSKRIEQESVRQMLFLPPDQHVALHFKVNADNQLFFIYASVVSEREVILQTRPKLLMGDICMTEELPGAALLPGGTLRKALPFEMPSFCRAQDADLARDDHAETEVTGSQRSSAAPPETAERNRSLPPIRLPGKAHCRGLSVRRQPHSGRRTTPEATVLPRMACARPDIPQVPYRFQQTPHSLQEAGRYEYAPPYIGGLDMIKRPLVEGATSRSAPPFTARRGPASSQEGLPSGSGLPLD